MKRLSIFSVYDSQEILDDATLATIADLKTCSDHLVVVINGNIRKKGVERLKLYVNQVVIRENTGFDAGAYKDVLLHTFTPEELDRYDEVVLCNDTFFGPFVKFKAIFETMAQKDCDFWGLCYSDSKVIDFIHSYFYCFHKKVFQNAVFPFFKDRIKSRTSELKDVYGLYERGLFHILCKQGYKFAAYAKPNNLLLYTCNNYLLREEGLPILKKKCFAADMYHKDNIYDALHYISDETDYDVDMILRYAMRKYGISITPAELDNRIPLQTKKYLREVGVTADRQQLRQFVAAHNKIYIYGAGYWAKIIICAYETELKNRMRAVVQSDSEQREGDNLFGYPVVPFSGAEKEMEDSDSGVIVALGKVNTEQVRPLLEKRNITALYIYG